jgi:SAM-dependent methyltransferase
MKQYFFICPRCRTALDRVSTDRLVCPKDGLEYWNVEGIWRFLLPESQAHYHRFMQAREAALHSEEGSPDPEYYRSLPFKDLSGENVQDWAARARGFNLLVKKVLTPIQGQLQRPLKILDLGAGNGWLSNQLASQEDRVVAVDLLVNEQDGLGAWKYYENQFTPIQADFHRLPVMDGFADVAIFNDSFHYSENYEETLAEALRAVQDDGLVVIMETPVYRRQASGEEMVAELKAAFQDGQGYGPVAQESQNFLTYQRVSALGESLGLYWVYLRPFYGIGPLLQPLKAWLMREGEPAKFPVIVGYRKET